MLAAMLALAPARAADLGGSTKDTDVGRVFAAKSGTLYLNPFLGASLQISEIDQAHVAIGPKGVLAGLRAGGDISIGDGYIVGLFAEGAYSGASARLPLSIYSIEQTFEWGGGVRVGRQYDRTLFYAIPAQYVRIHEVVNGADWSKDLGGYRVGLGSEVTLGSGYGLTFEAGWAWFQDTGATFADMPATVVSRRGDFRVGLTRRF